MRRSGILIAVLFVAVSAAAQDRLPPSLYTTPPNGDYRGSVDDLAPHGIRFDSIVSDPVAYQKILDKFAAGLKRPSTTECTIAYYGFACREQYSPSVNGEEDMQRAIMAEDYAAAYELGMQILEHAPVSLTVLYWTLFAATQTDQSWEVRNSLKGRYNGISYVISRSGNGVSPETALRVIYPGDMYTYTTMELDLEIGDGYLWDGRWTEFEVTPAPKYMHASIFFEVWNGK